MQSASLFKDCVCFKHMQLQCNQVQLQCGKVAKRKEGLWQLSNRRKTLDKSPNCVDGYKWAKSRGTQVWQKVCIKLPLYLMHVPNKFLSLIKNKKNCTLHLQSDHIINIHKTLCMNLSWDHFSSSLQAKTQQFGFWFSFDTLH